MSWCLQVSQLAGDDVELVYVFPGAADLDGYLEKMEAIMRVYRRRLVQLVRREPDADLHAPFTVANIDEKVRRLRHHFGPVWTNFSRFSQLHAAQYTRCVPFSS